MTRKTCRGLIVTALTVLVVAWLFGARFVEMQWHRWQFRKAVGDTDQLILVFDHYKCGTNYSTVANYLLKSRPDSLVVATSDLVRTLYFHRAGELPFELRTLDQSTLRSVLTRGNPIVGRLEDDEFVVLGRISNATMTLRELKSMLSVSAASFESR